MPESILTIDPGATTGWARLHQDGRITSGTWLISGRREPVGRKYTTLVARLSEQHQQHPLNVIAYELVGYHAGTAAAHVYGGYIAIIQMFCDSFNIHPLGVHWSTIKKQAGDVLAKKPNMVIRAKAVFGVDVEDHNQADALFMMKYAMFAFNIDPTGVTYT